MISKQISKTKMSIVFFINPTNQKEIVNIINNIRIDKSTGLHSIPTDILHLNISEPLAKIVNLSFENIKNNPNIQGERK